MAWTTVNTHCEDIPKAKLSGLLDPLIFLFNNLRMVHGQSCEFDCAIIWFHRNCWTCIYVFTICLLSKLCVCVCVCVCVCMHACMCVTPAFDHLCIQDKKSQQLCVHFFQCQHCGEPHLQFTSRKRPYVLLPVSEKFLQHCLWNSFNVCHLHFVSLCDFNCAERY